MGSKFFVFKHFRYWRKFPNILGVEGNVYKLLLYCQLIYLCDSHNIICCYQEWCHSHQEWYHSHQEWYHSDCKSCTTLVTRAISSPLKVISLLSQVWYHHHWKWYHCYHKCDIIVITSVISSPLKVISLLSQVWYHHHWKWCYHHQEWYHRHLSYLCNSHNIIS